MLKPDQWVSRIGLQGQRHIVYGPQHVFGVLVHGRVVDKKKLSNIWRVGNLMLAPRVMNHGE